MTTINCFTGETVDPYAPLGTCDICGAAAWTTGIYGVLCPSHENVVSDYEEENAYQPPPFADELVDALADVGITASVQAPYVIIDRNATLANRCVSPEMVAWALDIDPALCCYNINGNIRITCN